MPTPHNCTVARSTTTRFSEARSCTLERQAAFSFRLKVSNPERVDVWFREFDDIVFDLRLNEPTTESQPTMVSSLEVSLCENAISQANHFALQSVHASRGRRWWGPEGGTKMEARDTTSNVERNRHSHSVHATGGSVRTLQVPFRNPLRTTGMVVLAKR